MPCLYFAFFAFSAAKQSFVFNLRSEGAMNRAPTFADFAFFVAISSFLRELRVLRGKILRLIQLL
jgi:hypothetical protein